MTVAEVRDREIDGGWRVETDEDAMALKAEQGGILWWSSS